MSIFGDALGFAGDAIGGVVGTVGDVVGGIGKGIGDAASGTANAIAGMGAPPATPEEAAAQAKASQDRINSYSNRGSQDAVFNQGAAYTRQGDMYSANKAPKIDYTRAYDYSRLGNDSRAQGLQSRGMAMDARGLGMDARGQTQNALGLLQSAAMGQQPSVAQNLMNQGNQQAIASQISQAASARGPAGLAMAGQNAAGNIAALQRQNVAQNAALRAQEMQQAQGAYMQGTLGLRGQDFQQQGADQALYGMDQQQRAGDLAAQNASAQMAQSQAQMEAQQRALNLQGSLGMYGLANSTYGMQQQANAAAQENETRRWLGQMGTDQNSRGESDANFWKAMKMGGDIVGATGDAASGKPGVPVV